VDGTGAATGGVPGALGVAGPACVANVRADARQIMSAIAAAEWRMASPGDSVRIPLDAQVPAESRMKLA
jgi:hypothetical protein